MLRHLLRPGCAVHADHIDVVRLQRHQRRADLGAEQHCSHGFHGHRHNHGNPAPGFGKILEHAEERRFGLQDILAGFEAEQIGTPFHQSACLHLVRCGHVRERDMPERRKLCRRAHRAGNEAGMGRRGILLRHAPGDLRRCKREFIGTVCETVFRKDDGRRAEAVRLDDVATGFEIVAMDVLHRGGLGDDQDTRCSRSAALRRNRRRSDSAPGGASRWRRRTP